MNVTVRLTVLKDKPYVKTPHFTTHSPHRHDEEFYCTTGVDSGSSVFSFYPLIANGSRTGTRPRRHTRSDASRGQTHDRLPRRRTRALARRGVHAVQRRRRPKDARSGESRNTFEDTLLVLTTPIACQVDMPNYVVSHNENAQCLCCGSRLTQGLLCRLA